MRQAENIGADIRANGSSGAGVTRRSVLARGAALALACTKTVATAAAGLGNRPPVAVYTSAALARYGFPAPHPFGLDRQSTFLRAASSAGLLDPVARCNSRPASVVELQRFHTAAYVAAVAQADISAAADQSDTPISMEIYQAARHVVGSALDGLAAILAGQQRRSLQPIGGLHHAWPDHAAGFCVFNDLGVLIASLRHVHGIAPVAYVDIDVHHGDGVFYAFESDPGVIIADIHQDGRTLFPGTGKQDEIGSGAAAGTKLNVVLPPRADDAAFMAAWPAVEAHLERHAPAFFILQCGADGLAGDPLGDLRYSSAVHDHVAHRLRVLADRHAGGRLMAFGGGGYDADNLAAAWCAVLRAFLA